MLPDLEIPDLAMPDVVLSSDFSGLEIYQCENWEDGSTHGGNIGSVLLSDGENVIFPRVTRAQNRDGAKTYKKTFWKNAGTETWSSIAPVVVQDASLTFSREAVTVAIGTTSDSMTNKPNDSAFLSQPTGVDLAPGETIPVWIRRIITPGGVDAESYESVPTVIQLQEV